jgi:hypothetical protein
MFIVGTSAKENTTMCPFSLLSITRVGNGKPVLPFAE